MSDENFVDLYGLLGLTRSASPGEIEEACLRLGALLRSEIEAGGQGAAEDQFKLVEKAFATLTNPEARAAYDHTLSVSASRAIDATGEALPPPHKREGILVMAGSISAAAIVIVAAVVMAEPTSLGVTSIIGLTTFRFLQYGPLGGFMSFDSPKYLIELDAPVLLLLCFLVGVYGILVFLAVLPRPSVLWRRLAHLWSTR